MLQLAGMMKCELVLSENDTILTTQHFSVFVNKSVINTKSKYEPTGANLATEAAVAKAKAEAIEYFETELTDIDETVTMKINLKADKANTLAGYGITDAYDKTYINRSLNNKLNKMPFDTVPAANSPNYVTSGTVYNSVNSLRQTVVQNKADIEKSLANKYDAANNEIGSGELSPAQTIYEGSEGNFVYAKNGDAVTVSVNITSMLADKNYLQMSGLPFPSKAESRLASIAVYSTKNNLRNVRIDGSWIYISAPSDKFVEDEKMNFVVTYIIRR